MTDTDRPKPASYGFDLDFANLANVKPMPVPGANIAGKDALKPAGKPAKTPRVKPQAKKAPGKPVLTTPSEARAPSDKPQVLKAREQAADAIAKSMGFAAREQTPVVLKKRRRTHHDEPVDQLSIRGPVRILNLFIDHCENNNLAYWEALEALLPKS